jgi:hypothetical protein
MVGASGMGNGFSNGERATHTCETCRRSSGKLWSAASFFSNENAQPEQCLYHRLCFKNHMQRNNSFSATVFVQFCVLITVLIDLVGRDLLYNLTSIDALGNGNVQVLRQGV